MWPFLLLCTWLLPFGLTQPLYVLVPIEEAALEAADAPAKALMSADFFGEVQRLFVGIYKNVQQPSNTLYAVFTHALLPAPAAASKKHHTEHQKLPISHKLVLKPFGSLSFTVGFGFNVQVSNNIGFTG